MTALRFTTNGRPPSRALDGTPTLQRCAPVGDVATTDEQKALPAQHVAPAVRAAVDALASAPDGGTRWQLTVARQDLAAGIAGSAQHGALVQTRDRLAAALATELTPDVAAHARTEHAAYASLVRALDAWNADPLALAADALRERALPVAAEASALRDAIRGLAVDDARRFACRCFPFVSWRDARAGYLIADAAAALGTPAANDALRRSLWGAHWGLCGDLGRGPVLDAPAAAAAQRTLAMYAELIRRIDAEALHPLRAQADAARAAHHELQFGPADLRRTLAALNRDEKLIFAQRFFGIDVAVPFTKAGTGTEVHYQPSDVDVILALVDSVPPGQRLVDYGSGLGLVAMMYSYLTGAPAVGIERQPALAARAQAAAQEFGLSAVRFYDADARDFSVPDADVHYFFNPFGTDIQELLAQRISAAAADPARTRPIYVGCYVCHVQPRGFVAVDGAHGIDLRVSARHAGQPLVEAGMPLPSDAGHREPALRLAARVGELERRVDGSNAVRRALVRLHAELGQAEEHPPLTAAIDFLRARVGALLAQTSRVHTVPGAGTPQAVRLQDASTPPAALTRTEKVRALADRRRQAYAAGAYGPDAFRADVGSLRTFDEEMQFATRFFSIDAGPKGADQHALAAVGGNRYMPTPVRLILRLADVLPRGTSLVDYGSGLGLVPLMYAFLTGARAVGVEVQPELASAARAAAQALALSNVSFVTGDVREVSVDADAHYFFNPFSPAVMGVITARLTAIADDPARRRALYFAGFYSAPPTAFPTQLDRGDHFCIAVAAPRAHDA